MNEGFWEFANRIIHSEVEMDEGSKLQAIHPFRPYRPPGQDWNFLGRFAVLFPKPEFVSAHDLQ
jgi:hypothetical protein